jgi:alanyl-tRNA synthetase
MVPFKPYFLGEEGPFSRAASCQRCFRTSDIEEVGRTSRHHTLFEMLGNFSFGDYFKEEAILWAWEFIVKELGIPVDRLWISIYKEDDDAWRLWKEIGVGKERIVRFGEEDNFWKMGPTGPCGPCSEIIYDQGEGIGCGREDCWVGCGCDRFLELWNLVFTQFDREEDGTLRPLPRPNIDTGMGLERLACIMQGKRSNFETDLIWPIIERISEISGLPYGEDSLRDIAFRIVGDHIRGMVLLIHDHVYPENVGRGYVLRNLLRRASWKGRHHLGLSEPFLYKLVPSTTKIFHDVEGLLDGREYISRIIYMEEERFINTLSLGEPLLDERITKTLKAGGRMIGGRDAFELYDTYGLPIEMIQEVARERGLGVDMEGFKKEMEIQQERSRARHVLPIEGRFKVLPKTDFIGYKQLRARARILTILKDGVEVETAEDGDEVGIVLDRTPFYAERGGQVGDTGVMKKRGVVVDIHDTRLTQMGHIHFGKVLKRGLSKDDVMRVEVNLRRREAIQRAHTSTHLLHSVLRRVLGGHVKQAGSLVEPDRLRFDFTHPSPLKEREIRRIEALVNEVVLEDVDVKTYHTTLEEAKKDGAIAIFEEEYGEKVRVVKISKVSLELCGGTHIRRTGQIGLFKITSQSGVAGGVRRIEALTGEGAYRYIVKREEMVEELSSILKAPKEDIIDRVRSIVSENRNLARRIQALNAKLMREKVDSIAKSYHLVKGVKVVAKRMESLEMELLRDMADLLADHLKSGIVILASEEKGRVNWIMKVTHDLSSKIHAGEIINRVAQVTGGGGGGRKDFGQAGGKKPGKVDEALKEGMRFIEEELG